MTAARTMTGTLRRLPFVTLLLTLLLVSLVKTALATTAVGIVNPQTNSNVSGNLTPAIYLINGTAFDADHVNLYIYTGAVRPVSPTAVLAVKRGTWEFGWDISGAAYVNGAAYHVDAVGVKKAVEQSNGTATNSVTGIVIDKPAGRPGGALTLIPSSVDTGLYLNAATIGGKINVQYRAIARSGQTLMSILYGETSGLGTTTALDAANTQHLNDDDSVSSGLRVSYLFNSSTTATRTLWAAFVDNGAAGNATTGNTSVVFRRDILVDTVIPTVDSITSSVVLSGGIPYVVLSGTATDPATAASAPGGNSVSGIADIKILAIRRKNADGSAIVTPAVADYLVIPAQVTYGATASSQVSWQAQFPDTGALIPQGTYDFTVIATDNAGNPGDSTAATANLTGIVVNTSVPTSPAITTPAASTFVKGTINITGTASVTNATAGDVLTTHILVDGKELGTRTGTSFTISWDTTSFPGSSADGQHIITAYTVNNAGAQSPLVTPVTVTVDNTAPTGTLTAPAPAALVSGSAVMIIGTVADNIGLKSWAITTTNSAHNPVTLTTTPANATSKSTYPTSAPLTSSDTFNFTFNSTLLAADTYTLTLTVTDQANNTFTLPMQTFVVNNSGVTISVSTINGKTASSSPFVSNPISLTGSTSNSTDSWNVFDGGPSPGTPPPANTLNGGIFAAPQVGGMFSNLRLPSDLLRGTHVLYFVAKSMAGVFSLPGAAPYTVNVDDTAPNAPVITAPAGVLTSISVSGMAGEAAGAPVGNMLTTTFQIDGVPATTSPTTITGTAFTSIPLTPTPADGQHTIIATTTNSAGKATSSTPLVVTLGRTAPVITITSPANGTTVPTGTSISGTVFSADPPPNATSSTQVTFTISVSRGGSVIASQVINPNFMNGTATVPLPSVIGTQPNSALLQAGDSITINMNATDQAGNMTMTMGTPGTPGGPVIVTIGNTMSGISAINTTVYASDGTTMSRQVSPSTVSMSPTYIRDKFNILGIVNQPNLKSWSVDLYNITDTTFMNPLNLATATTPVPITANLNGTTPIDSTLINPDTYTLVLNFTDTTHPTLPISGPFFLVVDNTPPVITAVSPSDPGSLSRSLGSVSFPYTNLYYKPNTPITFSGTATDPNISSAYVLISGHDTGAISTSVNAATQQVTYTMASSAGLYTFQITALDKAGNFASSSTVPFTVDGTAPVVMLNTPSVIGTNGFLSGSLHPMVTLTGSISDANLLGWVLTDTMPGHTVVLTSSNSTLLNFGWMLKDPANNVLVQDGVHILTLSAIDKAGNTANTSLYVKVDSTLPPVPSVSPADGTVFNNTTTSPTRPPVLAITGTTFDANPLEMHVILDGRDVLTTDPARVSSTPTTVSVSTTLLSALETTPDKSIFSEGTHYFAIRAIDKAGNTQDSPTRKLVVDNTAPTLTLNYPTGVRNTNYLSGLVNSTLLPGTTTINPAVLITGTISDPNLKSWTLTDSVTGKLTQSAPTNPNAYTSDTLSYTWDVANAANGLHTLTLTAVDKAGNTATTSLPVIVDNINPMVDFAPAAVADGTVFNNTNTSFVLSGLITTEINPCQMYVYVDGVDVSGRATSQTATTITVPTSLASGLTEGTHSYLIKAMDKAGNTSVSSSRKIVVDNTPPSIQALTFNRLLAVGNINYIGGDNNANDPLLDPQTANINGLVITAIISETDLDPLNRVKYTVQILNTDGITSPNRQYANGTAAPPLPNGILQTVGYTTLDLKGQLLASAPLNSDDFPNGAYLIRLIATDLAQNSNQSDFLVTIVNGADSSGGLPIADLQVTSGALFDNKGNPVTPALASSIAKALGQNVTVYTPGASSSQRTFTVVPLLTNSVTATLNEFMHGLLTSTTNSPLIMPITATIPDRYTFTLSAASASLRSALPASLNIVLDTTNPKVAITTPFPNQIFSPGDILTLTFDVTNPEVSPTTLTTAQIAPILQAAFNSTTLDNLPKCTLIAKTGNTTLAPQYDLDKALRTPNLQDANGSGTAIITGDALSGYHVVWQIRLFSTYFSPGVTYQLQLSGIKDVVGNPADMQSITFKVGP